MEKVLDRANHRAKRHSMHELKDRAFSRRLLKDYNAEEVARYKGSDLYNVIIQTSRLNEKLDYKKLSAPFDLNIKTGDILYWDRDNSHWLVYYQRTTEKEYFLGEIREASYLIKWVDEYGVVHEQLSSFSREQPSTIKDIGYVSTFNAQYLEGTGYLMMPLNETSLRLKRYDRFVIGRLTWKVIGFDETTFNNIIMFHLEETEHHSGKDTEDLPNGQVVKASDIYSSLDSIAEVLFGETISLESRTELNGVIVQDTYSYKTTNCRIVDGKVIFDTDDDVAVIEITSEKTQKTKTYHIMISTTPLVTTTYVIKGESGSTIKAQISYNYAVYKNINGELEEVSAIWSVDNENVLIVSQNEKEVKIKPLRHCVFTLSAQLENGDTVSKELTAKPLLG